MSPVTGVLYAVTTYPQITTNKSFVFASPDEGKTWVPVYEINSYEKCFGHISNYAQGYWYITIIDRVSPYTEVDVLKLKDLSKLEVQHLAYMLRERVDGRSYQAEIPVMNGTTYLSFLQEPLKNISIAFKGVSIRQLLINPSFELWVDDTRPTYWSMVNYTGANWDLSKSTSAKYGTYSCNITSFNTTDIHGEMQYSRTISFPKGKSFIFIVYVRVTTLSSNFMSEIMVDFRYTDGTYEQAWWRLKENISDWMKIWFVYTIPKDLQYFIVRIRHYGQGTVLLDGALLGSVEAEVINIVGKIDYITIFDNQDACLNSTYPTITILGQTISYSGQLRNGSSSSALSIEGELTGIVPINVSVGGSNVVRIIITETKILDAYNVLLRKKNNLWYGTAYSTNASINNFDEVMYIYSLTPAVTKPPTFVNQRLNVVVERPKDVTSTTVIYCPYDPILIYENRELKTTGYSYNPDTKLLIVDVTFSLRCH